MMMRRRDFFKKAFRYTAAGLLIPSVVGIWKPKPLLAARFFDGTNDYLSLASNANFEGFTAYTLTAWVYRTGTPSSDHARIISKANGSGSDDYHLGINADNDISARVRTDSGTTTVSGGVSAGIALNTWDHCLCLWDGTTIRTYVNANEKKNDTNTGTILNTSEALGVGGHVASTTRRLEGRVADAAIYAVALNTDEISMLAAGISPLRVRPSDLRGYWPIYGNSDPEPDFSGGGHNLTLNSAPPQADHAPVQAPFAFANERAFPTGAAPPASVIDRRRFIIPN